MTTINAVAYIVSGAIEILLPLALGLYFTRRFGTSWKSWFVGALMFLVSLVRLPVNNYVINVITSGEITYTTYLMIYFVASFTAGLFEETARYIGLRYLIKKKDYGEGVTYGAGHGGIESILLVGINVLTMGFILLTNPESIPETQLYSITMMPWYLPLVGAYERVISIAIHISLSVMVLETIRTKNLKYYLIAVVTHTAIDYLSTSALNYSILYAELVLTGFAIGLTQWAYTKIKQEPTDDTASPQP